MRGGIIICGVSERLNGEVERMIKSAGQRCEIHHVLNKKKLKKEIDDKRPAYLFVQSDVWFELSPYILNKYAEAYPSSLIFVFAYERLTPSRIAAFYSQGVHGFMDMGAAEKDITGAFRTFFADDYFLPLEMEKTVDRFHHERKKRMVLSDTDYSILRLYAFGNSVEEIAYKTDRSVSTVRNRIHDIHLKTGIHSVSSMFGIAIEIGCIYPAEMVTEEINKAVIKLEANYVYPDGRQGGVGKKRRRFN